MAGLTVGAVVGTLLKAFAAGGAGALGGWLVNEGLDNMQNNKTMQDLQNHVQNQTGVNIDGTKVETNQGEEGRPKINDPNYTTAELENMPIMVLQAYVDRTGKGQEILEKKWKEQEASGKNPEDEEKEQPTVLPETQKPSEEPTIKDETNQNLEGQINWLDQIEKWRNEQWAREDAIRAETQAREDSAYQRSVKDMQAAGINPNLMNVQPANAGGGISNATGIDTSVLTNQMQIDLEEMQQIIDNAFKEDENSKNRFMEIFQQIIQSIAMIIAFKK